MKVLGLLLVAGLVVFFFLQQKKKKKRAPKPREVNDFFAEKRAQIKQKLLAAERPLFIHNETTGLIRGKYTPSDDLSKVPRTVQIAWRLYQGGKLVEAKSYIIKPQGYQIPQVTSDINGITTEIALKQGTAIQEVLTELSKVLPKTDCVVSHYNYFRHTIIGADYVRLGHDNPLTRMNSFDMMEEAGVLLSLESNALNHVINTILPQENFVSQNDATENVEVLAKAFFSLQKRFQPT